MNWEEIVFAKDEYVWTLHHRLALVWQTAKQESPSWCFWEALLALLLGEHLLANRFAKLQPHLSDVRIGHVLKLGKHRETRYRPLELDMWIKQKAANSSCLKTPKARVFACPTETQTNEGSFHRIDVLVYSHGLPKAIVSTLASREQSGCDDMRSLAQSFFLVWPLKKMFWSLFVSQMICFLCPGFLVSVFVCVFVCCLFFCCFLCLLVCLFVCLFVCLGILLLVCVVPRAYAEEPTNLLLYFARKNQRTSKERPFLRFFFPFACIPFRWAFRKMDLAYHFEEKLRLKRPKRGGTISLVADLLLL